LMIDGFFFHTRRGLETWKSGARTGYGPHIYVLYAAGALTPETRSRTSHSGRQLPPSQQIRISLCD
jgi:hypothetical protein